MTNNIEMLLKSIDVPGEAKTLTKEEEINLGTIIQDPNSTADERQAAIETLVLKNIYLVLKLVHKYKRTAFDFEDLVSYGILGLFTAARKYDPVRANRFASYARHWIKESVMKAVREYSGTPKIPVYLVKDLWNVTRILSKNDSMSNDELSDKSGLPIDTVSYLRTLLFKNIQFDQEYTEVDNHTPEQALIKKERVQIFQNALDDLLTADELTVLSHSCELNGCTKMTFAVIEYSFKIKNARRLKASAISKLSTHPQLKNLYKDI